MIAGCQVRTLKFIYTTEARRWPVAERKRTRTPRARLHSWAVRLRLRQRPRTEQIAGGEPLPGDHARRVSPVLTRASGWAVALPQVTLGTDGRDLARFLGKRPQRSGVTSATFFSPQEGGILSVLLRVQRSALACFSQISTAFRTAFLPWRCSAD